MSVATTLSRFSTRDVSALAAALLAVLLAFWILIASLARVVVHVDEPFPGVLANHRLVVTNTGQYDWTGSTAGLKYPDKILAVDGTPVDSLEALYSTLEGWDAGVEFYYSIKRGNETLEVEVPSMEFSWADFLLKFIVSHPAVNCAIPATTRVDHLNENMRAGRAPLPSASVRQRMIQYIDSL